MDLWYRCSGNCRNILSTGNGIWFQWNILGGSSDTEKFGSMGFHHSGDDSPDGIGGLPYTKQEVNASRTNGELIRTRHRLPSS